MLNNSKTETEYETLIVELKAFIAKLNSPHSIDEEDGSLQSTVNGLRDRIDEAIIAIVGTDETFAKHLNELAGELQRTYEEYNRQCAEAFSNYSLEDVKGISNPNTYMLTKILQNSFKHYLEQSGKTVLDAAPGDNAQESYNNNNKFIVLAGTPSDLKNQLADIAATDEHPATVAFIAERGHIFTVLIPANQKGALIVEPYGNGKGQINSDKLDPTQIERMQNADALDSSDLEKFGQDKSSFITEILEAFPGASYNETPAGKIQEDTVSCGRIAFAVASEFAEHPLKYLDDANALAIRSVERLRNTFSSGEGELSEHQAIDISATDEGLLENYSKLIAFFSFPLTDEEINSMNWIESDQNYHDYFMTLYDHLVHNVNQENKELLINIHNRFLQKANIILANPGEDSDASEVLFGDFTIGDLTEKVSEIEDKLAKLKSELETGNSSDYFEDHDSDFYANESSEDSESPLRNIETLKGLIKEIQSEIDDIKEFQNISLGTDDEALSQDELEYCNTYKQCCINEINTLLEEGMRQEDSAFWHDFCTNLKKSDSFEEFEEQFPNVTGFPAPDSFETIQARVKKLMDAAKEMARNGEFAPRQSELNTDPTKTKNEPPQKASDNFNFNARSDSLSNEPQINSDESSSKSHTSNMTDKKNDEVKPSDTNSQSSETKNLQKPIKGSYHSNNITSNSNSSGKDKKHKKSEDDHNSTSNFEFDEPYSDESSDLILDTDNALGNPTDTFSDSEPPNDTTSSSDSKSNNTDLHEEIAETSITPVTKALRVLNAIFYGISEFSDITSIDDYDYYRKKVEDNITSAMSPLNAHDDYDEFNTRLNARDKYGEYTNYRSVPRTTSSNDMNSQYYIQAANERLNARLKIIEAVDHLIDIHKKINIAGSDTIGNFSDSDKEVFSTLKKLKGIEKDNIEAFIDLFNKNKPNNMVPLGECSSWETIARTVRDAVNKKMQEFPKVALNTPTEDLNTSSPKSTDEIIIEENSPEKSDTDKKNVSKNTSVTPKKDSIPDFCFFHNPVSKRKADDNQNHDDVKISIKNITLEPEDIDKLKEGLELFSQNHNITLHAHYDSANKVFSMGIPTEQTLAKLQLKGKPEALKKQKQVATFEMMLTYFKNKTPDSKIVISGNNPELVALAKVMAVEISAKLNKTVPISIDPPAKEPTKVQIAEAKEIYGDLKKNAEITIENSSVDIKYDDTTWENFSIHSR